MTASIAWLLSMFTQLRKRAAGDIVPSFTKLQKDRSEWEFSVTIYQKLGKFNKYQTEEGGNFQKLYFFSYLFLILRGYKAALRDGNKYAYVIKFN